MATKKNWEYRIEDAGYDTDDDRPLRHEKRMFTEEDLNEFGSLG